MPRHEVMLEPEPFQRILRDYVTPGAGGTDARGDGITSGLSELARALASRTGTYAGWHRWIHRTIAGHRVGLHHADVFALVIGAHLSAFDPYYQQEAV